MMKFVETRFADAWLIELQPFYDERGFFAVSWNLDEFQQRNLFEGLVQTNLSLNTHKGTVRGMHFQHPPYQETKLVRCIRGRIFDVIVDIRPNSSSYLQWQGFELSADNRHMLYIPKGFAHGYQTLEDDTEIFYMVSEYYHPEKTGTIRWNDPALGIEWPLPVTAISDKDAGAPDWNP